MIKKLYPLVSLVLLVNCLFSLQSFAQWEVRPDLNWKVLHTPHFDVVFNTAQQGLAEHYSAKLETAYSALQPYFSEAPERTSVVINDKTDITNGFATRIPYPYIMIYPVLPGPQESLADYGDWAYELLTHEYTHILNLEPAGGVMKPIRSILGSIVAPNLLLPTWWKEGLAVEMETRLSQHGRLRSVYQESVIRAMVEDQTFYTFDIAQANEVLPSWPHGMRPYLFGSLIWSQMIADQGKKVVDQLNQHHGQRMPYFIEAPAIEHLNRNYTNEYSAAMTDTNDRALHQIAELHKQKPTPQKYLSSINEATSAPSLSPDGQHLAFISESDNRIRSIKLLHRKNSKGNFLDDILQSDSVESIEEAATSSASPSQNDEMPSGSIQKISWFPDSKKLVYDKIDRASRFESYSDLYTFDLETQKSERISNGLRAREPAVSPDGQKIVFIKLSGGTTELAVMDLQKNPHTTEILLLANFDERISYPSFLNDHEVLFSWRQNKGEEHLFKISLNNKKPEPVLKNYPDARFGKMTSQGFLFNSSKNGTQNLYLAAKDLSSARPVSNSLTAQFMSDMDPLTQDIYTTTMTSRGFKVALLNKKDWQATETSLPKISPLFFDRYAQVEAPLNYAANFEKSIEDYSAASYLWPHYWMPFIVGATSQSGLLLQASTSGFDPLKKHSYTLTASWDTLLNQGSFTGTYLNQVSSLPFQLVGLKKTSYLGVINNQLSDALTSLGVFPDVFALSQNTNAELGWIFVERSTLTSSTKRTGPFAMLSYTDYRQSGAEISPESGQGFYLGFYDFINHDDYLQHWQYLIGGEKYFTSPLKNHHAIMLRAKGIYTPENVKSIFGVSTQSLVLIQDNPLPEYNLRGYLPGQIYGRNLINVNIEYRMPVWNLYRGSGTDPLFVKRLSAAFVADGAAADGYFINTDLGLSEPINTKRWFISSGVEARLETTLGYFIPLTFVVGIYEAFNMPKGSETSIGTSLQISGF